MQSLLETSMPPPAGASVPRRPDELSAHWLTACLRHAGALSPEERVAEFTARRIGEGHGFAGLILRLDLQYAGGGGACVAPGARAPRRLVAKFATEHAPTRAMLVEFEGYAREVRFYRDVATRAGIPTPRCYFAHYDRASASFLLLLEDMAPASSVDMEQGLTLTQCGLVLSHLATMHARFWCRRDLESFVPPAALLRAVCDRFREALPGFEARYGARYPEITRVARCISALAAGDDFVAMVMRPPLTLTHQDLHVHNLLLPTAEGGRFALIDWQSVAASRHGVADVARVLGTCVTAELRREHGQALLRGYHERLRAFGVRGYTLAMLRYRLRQEMAAMVVVCVLALQTLDLESEQGQRAASILTARMEAALKDARVILPLRFMVLVFTLRRALRRWVRALAPRGRS